MRPIFHLLVFAGCSSGGLAPESSDPTHVLAGSYVLVGLTDSNLLLVRDQNHQISTLPMSGGKPTLIGQGDDAFSLNGVVFLTGTFDATNQTLSLASWTPSGGLHMLSPHASFMPPFVSADGQWLIYFDNVSSGGGLVDIISSRVDGSSRQTLAAQAPIFGCLPNAQTLGTAWLFSYCKTFDQSTNTGDANLERFDPVANSRTVLLADQMVQPFFTLGAAGHQAFAVDGQGNGLIYDTSFQASQLDQNVNYGQFTGDGAIIYVTNDHQLKRYQKTVSTLATLNTQTFSFLDDVSPDGRTVLVSLNLGQPYGIDLWAASAQTPSTPRAILDTPTGEPGGFTGVGSFTKDSSYILYIDPWSDNFYGPLHAAATAGGASALVANDVFSGFATHGSRLILCANQDQTARTCDLVSVDAAQPSKAVTVAGHVPDYGVFLTHDGSKIAWSIANPAKPDGNGVYLMATP